MTKNQKTFAYVGGGILLLLLLFRKKGMEKSLEESAPSEEGGSSGGGGGFFPVPSPAVIVNNTPYTPQSGVPTYNAGQFTNAPQNPTGAPAPVSNVQPTRETPSTPTPTPPITDISGAPVMSAATKTKFTDFDGDANFQDLLL